LFDGFHLTFLRAPSDSFLLVCIFEMSVYGYYYCEQEQFRKLLDINESLRGETDVISPTRELIKEGKIKRISARDGDIMDRYVFLVRSLYYRQLY